MSLKHGTNLAKLAIAVTGLAGAAAIISGCSSGETAPAPTTERVDPVQEAAKKIQVCHPFNAECHESNAAQVYKIRAGLHGEEPMLLNSYMDHYFEYLDIFRDKDCEQNEQNMLCRMVAPKLADSATKIKTETVQ